MVVHADWEGLESVSLPVLRQLYLGRRTRAAGRRVYCLDLPAGSPAREAFTRTVIGWSARSLDRYWLRQALSGGPPPPREVAGPAELLALVARQPGSLGYVAWKDLADAPPGVRVLAIEARGQYRHPEDAGYPIVRP